MLCWPRPSDPCPAIPSPQPLSLHYYRCIFYLQLHFFSVPYSYYFHIIVDVFSDFRHQVDTYTYLDRLEFTGTFGFGLLRPRWRWHSLNYMPLYDVGGEKKSRYCIASFLSEWSVRSRYITRYIRSGIVNYTCTYCVIQGSSLETNPENFEVPIEFHHLGLLPARFPKYII